MSSHADGSVRPYAGLGEFTADESSYEDHLEVVITEPGEVELVIGDN